MNAREGLRMTAVAAALAAAFGTAHAVDPEIPAALNTDAGAARLGIGLTTDDAPRFGTYTGLNKDGAYGLIDFNLVHRDDATGTWHWIYGRNLGLDSPQARFEYAEQGNWGYFIDFSKITRNEPLQVTTAVAGIGTPSLIMPAAPPDPGAPYDLKTKREAWTIGVDKFLYGSWNFQLRFRNEEKEGARLFARGNTGGGTAGGPIFGNFDFTPEPINSSIRQIDVKVNYTGTSLQLSGGYYGTLYNNQFDRINITGGSSTITPIALPPDNQSQQLYLTGGYSFAPSTRANFKIAQAKATQEAGFIVDPVGVPVIAGIGDNLMGRVDTTLMQAGVTARPMPKLNLLADFRYEDRDDKTRVRMFANPSVGSTTDGTNEPRSILTKNGKVEASYALPVSLRLTGGIDYEEKRRNTSEVRVVSYRETTEELSYRLELRRMMSETLTGAVSYVHSDRDGSPFQQTTVLGGAPGSNLIAPLHLADRKRDKLRLSANWMPLEPLTLQLFADWAKDSYSGRDGSNLGPREGEAQNISIDATYAFTAQWQANAWVSRNDTRADQATCESAVNVTGCPASAADPIYSATLKNLSNNFGLGMRGKPVDKVEIGADLSYSDIKDEYRQDTIAGGAVSSLPDISTKLTRLNLFGRYALQKNSGVRLDYIYDQFKTNDWTWATWQFADGTRVTDAPDQKVSFFGVSYYYRFQ